jgi:hypothetical protein
MRRFPPLLLLVLFGVFALPMRGQQARSDSAGVKATPPIADNSFLNFTSGLQIVPGIAVPIGVGSSSGQRDVFLYLSFEHAFR